MRTARCGGYVLSLLLLPAPSLSADVTASVNLSAEAAPLAHYWKRCVGSGHMLLGTRADWRAHLKLAHDELGFTGIRGHGLLDDDMSVVPNKKGGYEWYNVDQVHDYLMSLGIRPVVELSFMPKALVSGCGGKGQDPCSYAFGDRGGYKGLRMPPDNFGDWYDLVRALGLHLVDRYGLPEVSQWHFEVWNEMWGVPFPDPYMSLYNASAYALKSVDPSLRVGGPATMQCLDVAGFIDNCTQHGIPMDFVSTHYYPTDPQCQTSETKSHPDCFKEQVLAAQELAAKAQKPFFITEYNNGLGGTSRDDASAAAFVFRNVGPLRALDMWSWWTFSDVFEEGWMRSAPFHNGFGMMTMQGTRKPVWRAFELLAGAGDRMLPVAGLVSPADAASTVSVLATLGGAGGTGPLGLQLFVANYKRIGDVPTYKCDAAKGQCVADPGGPYTDPALCAANCGGARAAEGGPPTPPPVPAHNVTITIAHPADAAVPAQATARRIDSSHANPGGAWASMGSPTYPTAAELRRIDAASAVAAESVAVVRAGATASTVTFALPAEYAAVHISL